MLGTFLKGATASPPTLAFGAGSTNTANQNDYTFTGLSISSAAANRYVLVFVQVRSTDGGTGVTCTVGGASTTALSGEALEGGTNNWLWCFVSDSPVTTGTTATLVISIPGSPTACRLATYALYTSRPNSVVTQSIGVAGTGVQTLSSALTASEVGVAFGAGTTAGTITAVSISGPVTSDYNSGISESSGVIAATITGAGTITFTVSGTSTTARLLTAIWS